MITYIIVSTISGVLFGVLDGLINANPFAQRLYEVYKPIAKTSLNDYRLKSVGFLTTESGGSG